jgi:predicted GH43/DUF377 family glycosyl hydrolase
MKGGIMRTIIFSLGIASSASTVFLKRAMLLSFTLMAFAALTNSAVFGQYVWQKDARNPVFSGVKGSWCTHVFSPCVLYNSDSARYEMWFNATSGQSADLYWRPYCIGFATSKDGIAWTMYPSPVFSPDSGKWDSFTVDAPEVLGGAGQYLMWYSSFRDNSSPGYIGLATSSDGIHWVRYSGNPVFGPGTASWEAGGPYGCSVIGTGSRPSYLMLYAAFNSNFSISKIGRALSSDGITWERDTLSSPVLDVGGSGQWDAGSVSAPNVFLVGDSMYMYYVGIAKGGGNSGRTGLAVSTLWGFTWTKYAANPVVAPSSGTWDADRAQVGSVLLVGDTLHMWYDGWKTPYTLNQYSIGHALSAVGLTPVQDRPQVRPQTFSLSQNYPNPFNPTTAISYQLSAVSFVSLKVYNVLGQEVATLVNEKRSPGTYTVKFSAEGGSAYGGDGLKLASGVYFYRLQAGSFTQTRKMLLVK